MTIATSQEFADTGTRNESTPGGIALWRLYLLRVGYLLIAVAGGLAFVPPFFHHGPWTLSHGVMRVMLLALVLLSFLGLRYPVKMLPLLFWEMTWKASWLALIAFPAWRSGTMAPDVQGAFWSIAAGAIFLFVVPWDYVWRNFVAAKSDRWR